MWSVCIDEELDMASAQRWHGREVVNLDRGNCSGKETPASYRIQGNGPKCPVRTLFHLKPKQNLRLSQPYPS